MKFKVTTKQGLVAIHILLDIFLQKQIEYLRL